MNLPPKYYLMHYDQETGEVLSFHNPMRGKPEESPTLVVSLEQHAEIQRNPAAFKVVAGKVVDVDEVIEEDAKPPVDMPKLIIGGLVVDGICFALEPTALSPMLLDLAAGLDTVRAVTHTSKGTKIEILARDNAQKVAEAISDYLVDLHLG